MNNFTSDASPNYYKILNIEPTASSQEIKKAYRQLSMKHHPDRNGNSAESTQRFQQISEAYDVLGDAHKKKLYDIEHNQLFQAAGEMFANILQGQNVEDLLGQLFAGGGSGGIMPNIHLFKMPQPHQNHCQSSSGYGMSSSPSSSVERPYPLNYTLHVSFRDMFAGALVPLEIERWCMENGEKRFEKEILYVNVPMGVDENEIITVENKGNVLRDNCRGDVRISVKLDRSEFPEFRRSGLDLILEKRITLKEALCGFSFELKHINGTTYTINNTGRVIAPEFQKRIAKLGITREGHTGSLIIVFHVAFPEKLSDDVVSQLKDIDF